MAVVKPQDAVVDVLREIQRAQQKWGTSFDEKNTLNDWVAYINIYLGQAAIMGASYSEVITNLRKAAGLAINAIVYAENDALAPRHYDGQPEPVSPEEIQPTGRER